MLSWAHTHAPLVEGLLEAESVLEVGTGTGTLVALASRWAQLAVSIDIDRTVLDAVRGNRRRLRSRALFVNGDAFELPFRDGAFDVVFSQGLLEHFTDGDVRTLIEQQRRVARRVLVSVPGRWYPHVGRRGPGLIGNERLLSVKEWRRILTGIDVRVHTYRDPKVLSAVGVALGPKIHVLLDIPGSS